MKKVIGRALLAILMALSVTSVASATVTWNKDVNLYRFVTGTEAQDGGFGLVTMKENYGGFKLTKLNKLGDYEWSKKFAPTQASYTFPKAVCATSDNGLVVTGQYDAGNAMQSYLLKYSADGPIEWSKKIKSQHAPAILPTSWRTIDVNDVVSTGDGYLLYGGHYSGKKNKTYEIHLFVAKTDTLGDVQWAKLVRENATERYTQQWKNGRKIAVLPSGGYILPTLTPEGDARLIKIDETGSIVWAKDYSIEGARSSTPAVIALDDGSMIVAGAKWFYPYSAPLWVMKLNADGEIVWQKKYQSGKNGGAAPTL
ncbi:MAG: hypothetical protein OET90_00815, partial [Desulfuromonadales bacterium]|nr:hypothetical protein [Desulfuromonadales bacterium]